MVNKKFVKLGLIGVAVVAIAVGLGVGLGSKKANENKSLNSSNLENNDYGTSDAGCEAPRRLDGRSMLSVPGYEEHQMAEPLGQRRALRQEMFRTLGKISKGSDGSSNGTKGPKGSVSATNKIE